jgi:hypothetical protein
MIADWIKRKLASARQTQKMKRKTAFEKQEKIVNEWKREYFHDISFPIVIIKKDDYLAVSDLLEYFYDVDINIWFVNSECELVDSTGQKYNFKEIEKEQWVPNNKIGTIDFNELKTKIKPLIYMPSHKQGIDSTKTIRDITELLINK